ncbi:MAG: alpha-amylase family protein [Sphingomonas sp.]
MISDLWYKNAIIYSMSLESFLDADGDGIGDLEGATRRLDYLQGLGITAIWLAPFQPSPRRDGGYDIADFYGVDPRYGSLGDFVEFTRGAEERGIRVMMDLVINHTSDEHPWFKAACADPQSRFRDFYIWADKKPKGGDDGVVFPGVQKSTWTYNRQAKAWYFHKFRSFQPDLNISNPEVRAEMLKIVGFWLELGVSGFRMDAVPFLIAEDDAINLKDPPKAYQLLREIRALAQWRRGDAVLLAEANIPPARALDYFGEEGDRLHMLFNFPVNQALFYALATADSGPLRERLAESRSHPESAQWANFLRNHDELDLGRLSDEQREQVFAAFAPDKDMQLYDRGIRRRLMPMLHGDRRRYELATSLMMTLPGTPVIRYGDEIGMGDDLSLPDRDCARTPMQWSDEPNGGFSLAGETTLPAIAEGPYRFDEVNVTRQRVAPESLLNWTERIIRRRKEVPEIGRGDYAVLDTPKQVVALRYAWLGNTTLFLHNLCAERMEIELTSKDAGADLLVCLLTGAQSGAEDGRHTILLDPYGYNWFRAGGLDDLLNRRRA